MALSAQQTRQNAARDGWSFEDTDRRLAVVMAAIHTTCRATAEEYGVPGAPSSE